MSEPIRITAEEARRMVVSGEALLVCAYNDDERFKTMRLEGAIPYSEFRNRLPSLPKDKSIIFY